MGDVFGVDFLTNPKMSEASGDIKLPDLASIELPSFNEAETVEGPRLVPSFSEAGPMETNDGFKNLNAGSYMNSGPPRMSEEHTMKEKYGTAGMKVHGRPYNPPHILFWNLRSTSGFPTLSSQANASMMSGFSPALLNLFCDQGMEALQSCTPWSLLEQSLDNPRYHILGDQLSGEMNLTEWEVV
jgi:hypothetical protein